MRRVRLRGARPAAFGVVINPRKRVRALPGIPLAAADASATHSSNENYTRFRPATSRSLTASHGRNRRGER